MIDIPRWTPDDADLVDDLHRVLRIGTGLSHTIRHPVQPRPFFKRRCADCGSPFSRRCVSCLEQCSYDHAPIGRPQVAGLLSDRSPASLCSELFARLHMTCEGPRFYTGLDDNQRAEEAAAQARARHLARQAANAARKKQAARDERKAQSLARTAARIRVSANAPARLVAKRLAQQAALKAAHIERDERRLARAAARRVKDEHHTRRMEEIEARRMDRLTYGPGRLASPRTLTDDELAAKLKKAALQFAKRRGTPPPGH